MKSPKKTHTKRKFHFETWQIKAIFLMAYDVMVINVSYFWALWIRFDGVFSSIPEKYIDPYVHFIPIYTLITLVVFYLGRMYHSVWEYVSIRELMRAAIGSIAVSVIHTVLITLIYQRMPISYYLWGASFQLLLVLAARFSYRIFTAVPQL
ncbi:MAG: polysaccharide biosynthesis protein, partial [Clostridia bacterium]|nr:polysaccharide biosynthesis protein [Clostridia bacterium]